VKATEVPGRSTTATPLRQRYSHDDLRVLSADERARFLDGGPTDPQQNPTLG